MMRDQVSSLEKEYRRYKKLAEDAIAQTDDATLSRTAAGFDNSIAVLVQHISGNLKSRFTDFLTADGEKPWRGRDDEFATRAATRAELLNTWEDGWGVLFHTLDTLSNDDLARTVTIRQEPMRALDALHRSLAHVAYHVGQIVYIVKAARGHQWRFLSILPKELRDRTS